MKTLLQILLVVSAFQGSAGYTSSAHPASGIAVNEQGEVFFIHTGRGLGKIDQQGNLTYVHSSEGGHWLCLDTTGSFSRTQPRHFQRITAPGEKPAIIFADGGSPIAVLPNGSLYYVSNDDKLTPGGLHLTCNSAAGELSLPSPSLNKATERMGITGLAAGPDGHVYVACPNAVFRMNTNGTFATIAASISLPDCDVDYPDGNTNMALPALRGLAADKDGNVFATGTGCHVVLKITPNGKVRTVLTSERPWSPTGVAVREGDVYVLEYSNANKGNGRGWFPRVRKLGVDGAITTLVTLSERNAPAAGNGESK